MATHDVFLSHSAKDRDVADAACAALEARGVRCWVAPRDITPGREWSEAIIEALQGARVMVLVYSGHANTSPQVLREVERAVSRGIPIVPFRIEDVPASKSMEYFISTHHWLDAFPPPLHRHVERLAATVEGLLSGLESPAPVNERRPRRSAGRPGLVAAVMTAALVAAVATAIAIQARTGAPSVPSAAAEALSPTLVVSTSDPQTPGESRRVTELAGGFLPPGGRVVVTARLPDPRFVYIVWISPESGPIPIYPWRVGDWRSRPADEQPVRDVTRDVGRLTPSPTVETVVLLARSSPLPSDFDLRGAFSEMFPEAGSVAPAGDSEGPVRGVEFEPAPSAEKAQAAVTQRLGREFDVVRVTAFGTDKPPSPRPDEA